MRANAILELQQLQIEYFQLQDCSAWELQETLSRSHEGERREESCNINEWLQSLLLGKAPRRNRLLASCGQAGRVLRY